MNKVDRIEACGDLYVPCLYVKIVSIVLEPSEYVTRKDPRLFDDFSE